MSDVKNEFGLRFKNRQLSLDDDTASDESGYHEEGNSDNSKYRIKKNSPLGQNMIKDNITTVDDFAEHENFVVSL